MKRVLSWSIIAAGLVALPIWVGAQSPTPISSNEEAGAEIRLDVDNIPPLVSPTGRVSAYPVTDVKQLAPGQLADTFFGDYVLQNNTMRVTISNPEKKHIAGIGGGHIIDVVSTLQPNDYLNYVQNVPDVESTMSQVIYNYANEPLVLDGTTATLALHGTAEIYAQGTTETSVKLDVVTTYSLAKDSNVLAFTTQYTNKTSETVTLQPGDLIDWGQASTFVEGVGLPGNGTVRKSNFVVGFADNFSLGYITGGSEQSEGLHTIRDSLITIAAREGELAPAARVSEDRQRAPNAPDRGGFGVSGANSGLMQALNKAIESPRVETGYKVETIYGTNSSAMGTSAPLIATEAAETTSSQPAPRGKATLAPGETLNFDRYLVLSNKDFTRIARAAYQEKDVETGVVAGAVLETGSQTPIANADIFISGGPNWDGKVTPSAFYRANSRKDGTFVAYLPVGKYMVSAAKVGRGAATPRTVVDVTSGTQPQVLALALTPECIVNIAVSEAETETSSPLPCKVTFIPKQGSLAPDWGLGPRGDQGVRNVYYLPYGAARIPLSPGNYVAVISRGIEYDIVRKDLQVRPGTNPTLLVSLPHSLKGRIPGMFSVDPGVMTTASAVSNASPEDRVIQAACEGVHILVSGDLHTATDLQAVAKRLGLSHWVKAFTGVRLLLHKNGQTAEVLAYPLVPDTATSLTQFAATLNELPPDVALADLRRNFPGVILTLTSPMDPLRGYLNPFEFNEKARRFADGQVPPPDFDAMHLIDGKKLGVETLNYPRYIDLQMNRTQPGPGKSTPLSPTAASNSRLTYGEEIGYPRMYLYTNKNAFSDVTAEDLVAAVRGQRFLVTNGPIVLPKVQKLPEGDFVHKPGDVVDLSTTEILRLRVEVFAAPWVSLSSIAVREYGWVQATISDIRPHEEVRRYPVQDQGQTLTRYFSRDAILDVQAFSSRRTLNPVVPDAGADFGGAVYPYAYTAPYFVDKNGDGRIELQHEESILNPAAPPTDGQAAPRYPAPDEE